MEFSERLVQTRKQRGLSQETLAEQIGVSRQAVSKWETGEAMPDYAKLVALADALDISMDYLCGRNKNSMLQDTPVSENPPSKKASFPRGAGLVIAAIFLAVLLLFVGIFIGSYTKPVTHSLPDTVTVSGFQFHSSGKCFFVPSVADESLTYQVSFRSSNGTEYTFDAPLEGGSCYASVSLKPTYSYTVTAVISNGIETRLVLLATNLSFGQNSASWTRAD